MTSHTNKQVVLCECCEKFRDIDKFISSDEIKHHSSYTALCECSDNGCKMCQILVDAGPRSSTIPANFDEDLDVSETQIFWKYDSSGSDLFLCQYDQNDIARIETDDEPLASVLSGRPIQTTSRSEKCYDLLSIWRSRCENEHHLCPRDEDASLPSRVIDVGTESQSPFLKSTNGQTRRWATLSHCWGNCVPTTTTKDTIRQREISIPLETLPPTFQDAILLTRKLGLQYIWIDSLCIIQDSPEDWAYESVRMSEVYSNASINISATAVRSSEDGIFNSGDKKRCYMQALIQLSAFSKGSNVRGNFSFRLREGRNLTSSIRKDPLHERAWVLQETTLSPRRVDFADDQLYWNCRTTSFKERDPHIPLKIGYLNLGGLFQMPFGNVLSRISNDTGADSNPVSWWYHTLLLYCDRRITFPQDNLPAIAGIALQVQVRTGYTYKAGLWLEDFHRGLLWQPNEPIEYLENTPVPSWSWASTNIPWEQRYLYLDIYLPDYRASILEVGVQTLNDSPFGQIVSASLMIEGGCNALGSWQLGTNITYNTPPYDMRIYNKWLSPEARLYRDRSPPPFHILCTLDESREIEGRDEAEIHEELIERKVIFLQIAKFGHSMPDHFVVTDEEKVTVYALILEPTGRVENEYKRIGIVEIPDENGLAEGWPRRVVSIV